MLRIRSKTMRDSHSEQDVVSAASSIDLFTLQQSDPAAEQEADQAANQVCLSYRSPVVQCQATSPIGQKRTLPDARFYFGPTSQLELLEHALLGSNGKGHPIDETTKNFMEQRFNADFSSVRIHTDNEATQSNEILHARAFTFGHNIFFNKGYYNPSSGQGKRLLAHELTHTLQQKSGGLGVQKEDKEKDPIYSPEPDIDFNVLMPELQLRLFHFLLKADTSKVHLDYQTRNFMAGLSYQYGDALSLNLKFRDFKTKLGWTPGDNEFALGLNQGDFGLNLSTQPWNQQVGLGLTYGLQLPSLDQMHSSFTVGGNSAMAMAMGIPGAFDDPFAYYHQHKDDIENISKTADMLKKITKAGESKIRLGAGLSLSYDPDKHLVITGRFGLMF